MFARWQFEVFVLLVCVAKSVCTDDGPELNQADAENVLDTQTTLRRHFIESLANLQDKIFGFTPFHSIVNGILQGLQSRDLDPLQSFTNGYSIDGTHSPAHHMATLIYSMQGCGSPQTTLADWHSFLQTIPDIDAVAPPPPFVHPLPRRLHEPNTPTHPYVLLVLFAIHHNRLQPTKRLLGDILYNFRFENHSPDLDMTLADFIRMLNATESLPDTFRSDSASIKSPSEILSDILRFTLRQRQSDPGLTFRTAQLLSALSNPKNVDRLGASTPAEMLELIGDDDYPPDIVRAAVEVAAAVSEQVNVDAESLKGYSPQEKLLGLISQLSALPSGNPLSGKVHAIYPHVKLRYLSNKGQFFRPHTASDVAFLLNSFLTIPNPLLIGEIHKIFLLPHFDWQTILGEFDYSKYSKPRSLLMDMLQELLRNSDKLPACDLILFSYFLRNNSRVPACTTREISDDVLGGKLASRTTPIIVFPDVGEVGYPTAAPPEAFQPNATAVPCSDGPPVELVDPNSITEIFSSNHDTAFISDMIRSNPMPADSYPNTTRRAVYETAMDNLRTGKYSDSVTAFVIQQALARTPLNEKANLPPSYLTLCPSQVADFQVKPLVPAGSAPYDKINCKPPSAVKDVIDRDSLLEIIDGADVRRVQQLLSNLSLPVEEYLALGDRRNVLLHILGNSNVDSFWSDLQINEKGHLLPVVKRECAVQTLPRPQPTDKCPPHETPTPVYDLESVFEALDDSAPNASFVRHRTETFLIPFDPKNSYSKPQALEIILNALAATTTDQELLNQINALKIHIVCGGREAPRVVTACLPKDVVEEQQQVLPGDKCPDNESSVAVVNADTIFDALGPNAPAAPDVRARIKALIIPVNVRMNLTKADVLRDVLTLLEGEDSGIRTMATALKESIMSNGSGVEEPDVVHVCMSDSVVKDIREYQARRQATPPTAPAVVTIFQPQQVSPASVSPPREAATTSPPLHSITVFTTASSTSPISVARAMQSPPPTTSSPPSTADVVTAPSQLSSPPSTESTTTVSSRTPSSSQTTIITTLPPITTAPPTVGSVDTTPSPSHAPTISSSSFSHTTDVASFLSSPSPASPETPTAVLSRLLQFTSAPPFLSSTTLFTTSPLWSSLVPTDRPPDAANSNRPQQQPPTTATSSRRFFPVDIASSAPVVPPDSTLSTVTRQSTSPTWAPGGDDATATHPSSTPVLPTERTELEEVQEEHSNGG